MIQYLFYKLAMWLALALPLKAAYRVASFIAFLQYEFCFRDRRAVRNNLKTALGTEEKCVIEPFARAIFKNFAKYLVDFLRFSVINEEYIAKFVKIEGEEYLKEAFAKGKGVIALTAHVGNWELAGILTAFLGYSVNAIALNHRYSRVNELFVRQRQARGVNVIPLGSVAVRKCFAALKNNELIGLLGDRDFTGNGIDVVFFGKTVSIPKGPAIFSLKAGAVIVPTFAIREPDDTYRLIYQKPVDYTACQDADKDLKSLTEKVVGIIEENIKRYPEQWFMFREFWSEYANKL